MTCCSCHLCGPNDIGIAVSYCFVTHLFSHSMANLFFSIFIMKEFLHPPNNRRDGIVIRASALQSVDLELIPQVESYQKDF